MAAVSFWSNSNGLTLMWFLNVVLPVVIGSYYVLNFKVRSPALATTEIDKT